MLVPGKATDSMLRYLMRGGETYKHKATFFISNVHVKAFSLKNAMNTKSN